MIKIAFDLDFLDNYKALMTERFTIARALSPQFIQTMGTMVAFGNLTTSPRQFTGLARFAQISSADEYPEYYVMHVEDVIVFKESHPTTTTRPGPDIPFCWLQQDEATLLFENAKTTDPRSIEEPSVALDIYARVAEEVLQAYEHKCALTDEPASYHDLVAIQPRELGGFLHTSNYIPICGLAREAFVAGRIGIETDFRIRADLSRLGAALQARLRPSGRIRVPKPRHCRPDAAFLSFHLKHVFGARPSLM
ncbi:hypothetical protein [Paradevosia shaoguanensis]|uniref:hypothetical protein n=1 Tax=Paradevosia shaoguanensis TaxID=1335043 RepID=UPI003C77A2DC